MPDPDGFALLERAPILAPTMAVVVMTALDSARAAVRALRLGARDFLVKPSAPDEVRAVVARLAAEREGVANACEQYGLLGASPAMRRLHRMVPLLAHTRETVLITGETGTGKELLARAVHAYGPRRERPFVAHNMAATPSELAESLFFGHVRGAFSGATGDQVGLFERAEGGTVFLDEVDSFPLPLQAKLLRVLEGGAVRRLGSATERPVDARVIAASATDLAARAASGLFRADLYFRLRQLEVSMPPLRSHLDDVPMLVEHFLRELAGNAAPQAISPAALDRFASYEWPGNCRELRNTVRSAALLAQGKTIQSDHLPPALSRGGAAQIAGAQSLADAEREHIRRTLEAARGNRSQAARMLGIDRGTLARKLRAIGVDAPEA